MGNCLSGSKKTQGDNDGKVTLAILGLDNAGKTVAAKGLQGESLDTVAPTVGFSSIDFKFEKHSITMFDLGGGKRIRDIWKNYFAEIYGVIYVVDSSDAERLEESREVLRPLIENSKISGKPVLLLANKQDKQGALDELEICQHLQLEDIVNMNKCPCRVETCSAILGQGKKLDPSIRSGFKWLLSNITSDWERLHRRVQKDVADLRAKEAKEKKERTERVRKIREERERKEREERIRNGEPEEGDEEDEPVGFRRLDQDEIARKEAKLKDKKQKEKGRKQNGFERDSPFRSSRRQLKRGQMSKPGDMDNGLPGSRTNFDNGFSDEKPSSYLDINDDCMLTQSALKLSLRTSIDPDISPRLMRRKKISSSRSPSPEHGAISDRTRLNNRYALAPIPRHSNGLSISDMGIRSDGEDELVRGSLSRSPWLMQKAPPLRPSSPTFQPPPSRFSSIPDTGSEDNESDHMPRSRGSLMPLSPLEPLNSMDNRRKKKRKKKVKKNQTVPTDDEGYDTPDHQELPPYPSHMERAPSGQHQPIGRASRSPRLEPLEEPENENDSFSQKWGLADDLPELPNGNSVNYNRRFRPNSEAYDDLIT